MLQKIKNTLFKCALFLCPATLAEIVTNKFCKALDDENFGMARQVYQSLLKTHIKGTYVSTVLEKVCKADREDIFSSVIHAMSTNEGTEKLRVWGMYYPSRIERYLDPQSILIGDYHLAHTVLKHGTPEQVKLYLSQEDVGTLFNPIYYGYSSDCSNCFPLYGALENRQKEEVLRLFSEHLYKRCSEQDYIQAKEFCGSRSNGRPEAFEFISAEISSRFPKIEPTTEDAWYHSAAIIDERAKLQSSSANRAS